MTTLAIALLIATAGCRGAMLNAGLLDASEKSLVSLGGFRWETTTTPNFRVHAEAGTEAEARLPLVVPALERALTQVRRELQLPDPRRTISVFLVADRFRMQSLVGSQIDGRAFHATGVIALVARGDWDAIARHEITHILVGREWGAQKERWIGEGTATLVGDHYSGQHPHSLVRERLIETGRLGSLRRLARNFNAYDDDVAYLQSASLAGFIRDRYGLEGLRAVFTGGLAAIPSVTGMGVEKFEESWREHVSVARHPTILAEAR